MTKSYPQFRINPPGRDVKQAAKRLMECDDDILQIIAKRDPSMIRDVASRAYLKEG